MMRRRIVALLVALALLCALFVCACAESNGLSIVGVIQDEDDGSLYIEIENSMDDANVIDNYSVTLGGNPVTTREIKVRSGGSEEAGVLKKAKSWLFLVDISTVSSDHGNEPMVDTLTSLINAMGENDNAAIVTTARPTPGDLTNDRYSLTSQIKNATKQDTNARSLYLSIKQALDYMKTSDKLLPGKCLVVLSRGDNTDATGITLGELQTVVKETGIPIYTMAFMDGNASSEFGSLARQSPNGLEMNYTTLGTKDRNQIPSAAMLAVIQKERERLGGTISEGQAAPMGYIIRTAPPQKAGKDKVVELTFKNSADSVKATWEISSINIKYPGLGDKLKKFMSDLAEGSAKAVAIVAAAAIVLALIIALLIRKLKGGSKASRSRYSDDDVPPPSDDSMIDPMREDGTGDAWRPDSKANRRLQLTLKDISGKVYNVMMGENGVTIGRMADNQVVLDGSDKHISRHHLVINLQGEDLVLVNVSETNGAYVNDMKISGPVVLRQHDIIRVGSARLTLTWKYE